MVIPESYLAHGLFGRGEERANHKYVARIPTGKNSYRYFYSNAEYKAYKMGKSVGNRIDKMKDQTSRTIQAYNNKVRSSAKSTSNKVGKFIDQTAKSAYNKANNFVDEARKTIDKIGDTDIFTSDAWQPLDRSTPNNRRLVGKHTTKLNGKDTFTSIDNMDVKDVAKAYSNEAQRIAAKREKAAKNLNKYFERRDPIELSNMIREDPDKFAEDYANWVNTIYRSMPAFKEDMDPATEEQLVERFWKALDVSLGGRGRAKMTTKIFDEACKYLTSDEERYIMTKLDKLVDVQ